MKYFEMKETEKSKQKEKNIEQKANINNSSASSLTQRRACVYIRTEILLICSKQYSSKKKKVNKKGFQKG